MSDVKKLTDKVDLVQQLGDGTVDAKSFNFSQAAFLTSSRHNHSEKMVCQEATQIWLISDLRRIRETQGTDPVRSASGKINHGLSSEAISNALLELRCVPQKKATFMTHIACCIKLNTCWIRQ